MAARERILTQPCPHCSTIQELPAIFCWQCGGPLMKISKVLVMFFISITALAYGLYGLYAESLSWPIPLYFYYVFVFVGLSLVITRRYWWTSFRVLLWSLLLVYALSFLVGSTRRFFHSLSIDAIELMNIIRSNYLSMGLVLGTVFLVLVFGFVVLTKRFNFTLAYRIFLTFLVAATYLGGLLLEEPSIGEPRKMSSLALWLPEMTIAEFLGVTSLNLLRILAAEMVVYSMAMSLGPGNKRFADIARRMTSARPARGQQAVFLQATNQVTLAILRAGIYLQQFFITLWHTLANYAWGMYRVLRRLVVDFVTPLATLGAGALLLGMLAEHTAAYVAPSPTARLVYAPGVHSPLAMIGLAVLGICILHMVFLRAVTKFRWADLWRCNALLALWIGPFFLAIFLFISLSLIATGTVLRRFGNEAFPYRFGPLTLAAGIALVIMVGFALLYRQRGGGGAPGAGGLSGLSGLGVRSRLLLPQPSEDQPKEESA